LLDPKAVELCARKVAAVTGDIRKALDICKLAIENMQSTSASVSTATGVDKENANPLTPVVTERVGVRDVLRTINDVYGRHAATAGARLPMHDKLIVVAAISLADKGQASFGLDKVSTRVRLWNRFPDYS
jgi:cell division control protein 6